MSKLNLIATEDPRVARNNNVLLRAFENGLWTPDHLAARFSDVGLSKQQGYYQRLNGIVYFYAEICPDINNPVGGGATVSFTSGDVITLPFEVASEVPYLGNEGTFLFNHSVVLTQLSNLTKFEQCRVEKDAATQATRIYIGHTIPATASTFALEGFYVLKKA